MCISIPFHQFVASPELRSIALHIHKSVYFVVGSILLIIFFTDSPLIAAFIYSHTHTVSWNCTTISKIDIIIIYLFISGFLYSKSLYICGRFLQMHAPHTILCEYVCLLAIHIPKKQKNKKTFRSQFSILCFPFFFYFLISNKLRKFYVWLFLFFWLIYGRIYFVVVDVYEYDMHDLGQGRKCAEP